MTAPDRGVCTSGRRRSWSARARRAALALGVVLIGSCIAGGCRTGTDASADVAVQCDVSPSPPTVGPATLTLTLTDRNNHPVSGAVVRLEGDMTHPGMEPVFRDGKEVRSGLYTSPFDFSMAGDWIITVDATLPDGAQVRRQIEIRGVRSATT